MFIIENYPAAVICCIITMFCWGSWANTQKLAATTWRFELFYWDYVWGILLFSLILAFRIFSSIRAPFAYSVEGSPLMSRPMVSL